MVFTHCLLEHKEIIWKTNLHNDIWMGFTYVYFFSNWAYMSLLPPDTVGILPRDGIGKVTFVLTSVISRIWVSLFHIHQAHNLQMKWQRCCFYSICGFPCVLLSRSFVHIIMESTKRPRISVSASGKQGHSALSKPITGSLILSKDHYPKWWLKDPLKHLKTRTNTYSLWAQ